MKYVDMKTFLAMPAGTVYMMDTDISEVPIYDITRPLYIKGDTVSDNDWFKFELIELEGDTGSDVFADLMLQMQEYDGNIPVDAEPAAGRYGMYPKDDEIRFYVLDEDDTKRVIGLLQIALKWLKGEE